MKSFKVNVNPEVIKWSMETINIPEDIILKRLHTNKNIFDSWLMNKDTPTYVQLQAFAKLAGVSPLIFLSDKIPEEKPGTIFRNYTENNKRSYKTLKTIKRIEFLQNIAEELYDNLNENKEANIEKYNIKSKSEEIAEIERKKFSDFSAQKEFKNKYNALNKFRTEVENNNIIVMQFPFTDIRGFSLINKKPFFIVLNSKDTPESRIFTLFHEYAHLLLQESELNNYIINGDDKIEKWCDSFASYFLIADDILNHYFKISNSNIYKTASKISSQYKLSFSMILYRFYKLGYIDSNDYNKFLDARKNKDNKKGGGNYIIKTKSNYGDKFINLVFENYERQEITLNDALNYLNIKLASMDKLIALVNQ